MGDAPGSGKDVLRSSGAHRKKLKPLPGPTPDHSLALTHRSGPSHSRGMRPLPAFLRNVVKLEASSVSSAGGAKRMLVQSLNVGATLAEELPSPAELNKSFDDGLMQLRPHEIDDAVERACGRLKERFIQELDQLRECFGAEDLLSRC